MFMRGQKPPQPTKNAANAMAQPTDFAAHAMVETPQPHRLEYELTDTYADILKKMRDYYQPPGTILTAEDLNPKMKVAEALFESQHPGEKPLIYSGVALPGPYNYHLRVSPPPAENLESAVKVQKKCRKGAVWCSMVQYGAVWCSMVQYGAVKFRRFEEAGSLLGQPKSAVKCSMVQ